MDKSDEVINVSSLWPFISGLILSLFHLNVSQTSVIEKLSRSDNCKDFK